MLAPASSSSRQLRGWIDYSRGRIQEAVCELQAALRGEPDNPDTLLLLINCYLISGRVTEARPLLDRLAAIDPLTPLTRCMPAFADLLEGHAESAVAPYRQMLEMDPENPMARLFYVWVLFLNGRAEAAREVIGAFSPDEGRSIPGRLAAFLARAADGDRAGAAGLMSPDLTAAAAVTDVFSRILAEGYARLGLKDDALLWLQRAVERGFINYPFLAHHDPWLAPLRGDPQFAALLASVRERSQRFEV